MTKVQVGNNEMTPVAKWTKINADGSYTTGNGWLQNGEGKWSYDATENSFLPVETNGIKDPFGAFQVRVEGKQLQWEREEEGAKVIVTLSPIEELPSSIANELKGLWGLQEVQADGAVITDRFDPEGKHYIFIRWDREYRERTVEGNRASGYWHIHGHRPELTLIPRAEGAGVERWMAEVNNQILILKGSSEGNKGQIRTYQRLSEFPQ